MGFEDVLVLERDRQFVLPPATNATLVQSERCALDVSKYYSLTFFVRIKSAASVFPTGDTTYTCYANSISSGGFTVHFSTANGVLVPDEYLLNGSRWADQGANITIAGSSAFGKTFSSNISGFAVGARLIWFMVNNDASNYQVFTGDIRVVARGFDG